MMFMKCLKIAEEAHREQKDNQGWPYIGHLIRVASNAHHVASINSCLDADLILSAAILHDIIEDTYTTAHDLLDAGVSPGVVAIVQIVTRPVDTTLTYQQYIDYICATENAGAIVIKWADNKDNLNPDRNAGMPEGMEKRYLKARYKLECSLANMGIILS